MMNRLRRRGSNKNDSDSGTIDNSTSTGDDGGQTQESSPIKGGASRGRRTEPQASSLSSSQPTPNRMASPTSYNINNGQPATPSATSNSMPYHPSASPPPSVPFGTVTPLGRDYARRAVSTPVSHGAGSDLSRNGNNNNYDNTSTVGYPPMFELPTAWRINDPALRCSSTSTSDATNTNTTTVVVVSGGSGDKRTVYGNKPVPTKSQFERKRLQQQSLSSSFRSISGPGTVSSANRGRKGSGLWGRRRSSNGTTSSMYPSLDEDGDEPSLPKPLDGGGGVGDNSIHYFEVTIVSPSLSQEHNIALGFICDEREAFGVWPGELPNSIGWGSNGLYVNGKRVDKDNIPISFTSGDTVGCGIELNGMQRVFFTHRGDIVVPPTAFLYGMNSSKSDNAKCFPAVAFSAPSTASDHANSQSPKPRLQGNFGLDLSQNFRWSGAAGMSFLPQQRPGRIPPHFASTGSIPTSPPQIGSPSFATNKFGARERSRSPSSYYSIQNLEKMEDPTSILTRSVSYQPSSSPRLPYLKDSSSSSSSNLMMPNAMTRTSDRLSTTKSTPSRPGIAPNPPQAQLQPQQSLYGVNNTKKSSLEDDDPTTNIYMDHFKMPTTPGSTNRLSGVTENLNDSSYSLGGDGGEGRTFSSPSRGTLVPTSGSAGTPGSSDDSTFRRMEARRRREERSAQRRAGSSTRRNSGDTGSDVSVGESSEHSHSSHAYNSGIETSSGISHSTSTGGIASVREPGTPPSFSHASSTSMIDTSNHTPGNRRNRQSRAYQHEGHQATDPQPSRDENQSTSSVRPRLVPSSSIVVGGDGDLLQMANANSEKLIAASRGDDIDVSYVTELLECCRKDQERLQEKLSSALEEADAIENLEELFRVNDGICSAIEAGNNVLKRERELAKKKKSVEGPTIGVLVQNEDVFSLICMLRAPNEKRLQAALALMRFAKDDDALRNEIRSSGGMHSFLTLFRTKGMTKEIQVVSSLAISYVLPSFVASSQTTSSVGLKIMECLRFLVTSNPVNVGEMVISREEMCSAAASGVHVLWMHAIQPLITMEQTKKESRKAKPALRVNQTTRLLTGRVRSRYGGGIFDQGQESIEVQELTDLAVTLVAYLAKLAQSNEVKIEMGYGIVEQVCEVDQARPIAVREGLLTIFVEWIRSGDVDKIRPAASALRYLISISDKYMAGWIHSQVVNEGAIREIVKLLNESVGHDVRAAVAQILSSLCVAPHTRAAVVDANCVSYLVALLYEHTAPDSEEMVYCAGSALLQLAAGALTRASSLTENITLDRSDSSLKKQENVVNEIIEGWAHGSFVQIAIDHSGKLRSISVEALRVLSEDTYSNRQTRLQLCSAGAAEALGLTIKGHSSTIEPLSMDDGLESGIGGIMEGSLSAAVKDTYEALRGLANMLEPERETSHKEMRRLSSLHLDPDELRIKGCMDVAKSGGLSGILWVASLDTTPSSFAESDIVALDRIDLLEEAFRLLANLAPLLLSHTASVNGATKWSGEVFEAFDGLLKRLRGSDDGEMQESSLALNIDALKGMAQLAIYEPLKIRIVNQTLPKLLLLKGLSGERNDVATAASQVLLSLGFSEDEVAVQVAGNNPQLLVDWFCLQRALLLQAMARNEIRAKVLDLWQLPFSETDTENLEEMRLIRQISQHSAMSNSSGGDRSSHSEEEPVIRDLFENFTNDFDSRETRLSMVRQYGDVYETDGTERAQRRVVPGLDADNIDVPDKENLMSRHVFPLNDILEEREWVLNHRRAIESCKGLQKFSVSGTMPERVEKLLDCCFPSKLLRNDVVPTNDLRPKASFNFRALMMPKRRYFSFRREGQVLARMCDKHATVIDSDDVHWTLGFTNSTFAGEFVESLVQTLYLCPMITGLSFVRNADWLTMRDSDNDMESDDGGGLLANLTGSLPPWVSFLTFDNMLGDRDMRALVAILDTMGRLSSGQDFDDDTTQVSEVSIGQAQGKFTSFSIRNSPQVSKESWGLFFQMIGKIGPAKRNPTPPPLSSLKVLDLSGNNLGDESAAAVLELVHDKDSGCNVERLDLSGNRIGRGVHVIRVLRSYTEYYRYNQTVGVKMMRKSWKSTLHTLVLAENDLFFGQAGLEIFSLLKHNALCLRYLDLSNNSLEGDVYQLMASSLLKNTSLCHLNLSGNKFSPALIDLILEHLNGEDAESSLSFLLLENNKPPLNEGHRSKLANFLRKSRKNAIERYVKESESEEAAAGDMSERQGNDLDLIDEDTTKILSRASFTGRMPRPSLQASVDSNDPGDNKITVLFSAPLVFADGDSKLHPFDKLDFEMERELLWQCMKEASRDIEMSFDNAHHSRLLATVTRRCNVLHYSGHGHPNFLPFEDGIGGPNWLSVQNIEELILQDGMVPFKFVFVSACHSGLAGETFASAGVPHVVCCKQEFELKDTAALAFTRSFYLALLVGHTVKESFEQGKKAVRATPNLNDPDKEMKKFVLLPHDGDHNVPVFNAKQIREWPKQQRNQALVSSKSSRRRGSRGSFLTRMKSTMTLGAKNSELSVRNMMQEDPSPTAPQFFLGREVDMYYIISALIKLKKRLVTVVGETGIGRSSLVCAICHYINERASTISEIQHIYFIKPKHGGRNVSCRSLLRQLVDKLEDNNKCRPVDDDMDTEGMLDIICRSLKQDKALIVFDRTELLDKSDESQELPMILSTIMYETKQVKVVVTARNAIGQPSIGGQVEHPFHLGPLNFESTVKLFVNLCPHLHTPSERASLSKSLTHPDHDQKELLPNAPTLSQRTKDIFSKIGNGVPAKIEKAAYGISKEELQELAEQ